MKTRIPSIALMAGGLCAFPLARAAVDLSKLPIASGKEVVFASDIKPVLERSCLRCHGSTRPKSHFRVDSREALLKGGESGKAAILPGDSANSPLVQYVAGLVDEMEMPPLDKRDKYPPLAPSEIGLIRAWIDQGAKWPADVALSGAAAIASERNEPSPVSGLNQKPLIFDQIRQGDIDAVANSLKDRALLEARDEHGNTPLMQAAFYLDAKQVALILDRGADPNATNHAGATALMKAVWDLGKTRALLQHHAQVNAASRDGNTPLIIACHAWGSVKVVEELLTHGADVRAVNHAGANALMAAAEAGDLQVLQMLLDRHADPNSTGRIIESNLPISALMIASQMGHLDCVRLLLGRGAEVNFATEHGNALHFAAFTGRRDVARLLLNRGINVNVTGRRLLSFRNDTGFTPLMYAASSERNDPTLVQCLLERAADVNAQASSGETALSLARLRGETKIVAALLAAGARPVASGNDTPKSSPLWQAEQWEKPDSRLIRRAAEKGVSLLLESGDRLTEATGNRCFTCHQQLQPALACALAREKGFDYPGDTASDQLDAIIRAAKRRMNSVIEEPAPVPAIPAWLLLGLHAAGHPADELTDYFAYSLARYQYEDGRWITKASRAPTDYSDVTATALGVRALKVYAPPTMKSRLDHKIAKAALWLRRCEPQSTEEHALQILGLYWAGAENPDLVRIAGSLVNQQRADGGWAQIPTLESDAYATGLALYALNQSGAVPTSHPAYQKGIRFLLKTQNRDGSWRVPTRASPVQVAIEHVFSHEKDQWISSAATTWSTMALMLACETDR